MAGHHLKHLVLLLVMLGSNCGSEQANEVITHPDLSQTQAPEPYGYPCPDKNDIKPCWCLKSPEGFFVVDLHCPEETNETQLENVFKAKFIYKHFRSLYMVDNTGIKELKARIFHRVTFQKLQLMSGVLERVEAGALTHSKDTLTLLHFYYNNIYEFPLEDLNSFSQLREVRLYGNKLTFIPPLVSSTLEIFSVGYNPLQLIPVTTFTGAPALRELHLYGTNLTELQPGTFGGLSNLTFVSLRDNKLRALSSASVILGGAAGGLVYLQNNTLIQVAPDAFTGLGGGTIYLQNNALGEVSELVWRPVIEANVTLDLRNNPLSCGCDLAWLVLNPSFLTYIDPDTTCQDGQRVIDLDSSIYEMC